MSARRFGGMVCVYCSDRPAFTGDHIFARGFFVERARGNLPQAPTCEPCNSRKADLERYLSTVLPFGALHADAHENLVALVPRRLAGNLRLANELAAGRRPIWRQAPDVLYLGMTIPVDPQQITALFALVARGLAWFHWKTYLAPEHDADALMLTPFGQQYFDRLFARDLGVSGTQIDGREDFKNLVTDVAMGSVGAVFALEVSRLARSNLDWHRLLELCALTHTLVIDADGCYDPGDFNDGYVRGQFHLRGHA
jgi:hypothetical protein